MRTALPFLPQPVWQTAGSGAAAAKVAGTQGYVDLSLPQQLLQAKAAYDDQIYNRLMEYGAQLQVLGVLAGVFEATPDGVSGETLRAELAKVMAAYTTGLLERSKRTSWRQYDSLLDVASIGNGLLYKGAGWAASQFGADDTAQSLSRFGDKMIETDPNALIYNVGKDWLEKTIASCKARWDEFWLDVQQKGALVAMARLKADADFLAGEIALDIAMGVVTGGAAVGIKLVAKRLAGEVTEIAIRVASKVAANVPDANLLRALKVPDRAIDPKILNEILDEDKLGTGSKSADVSARGEVPDPAKQKPDGSASGKQSYRHPRDGQPPRSREELLPDGDVPAGAAFKSWWNDLSPQELDQLWAHRRTRDRIAERVRSPGGLHEWLMVVEGPKLKRLGFSMDEIKAMTTPTKQAGGPNPTKPGTRWRHTTDDGKTGQGAGDMHKALREAIQLATSRDDLLKRLGRFASGWLDNGANGFPPALRSAIIAAGG